MPAILAAALTKKLGVLRMPPACRPQDPKINPPAVDLFLAALVLDDMEKARLACDIVYTEWSEKQPCAGAAMAERLFREVAAFAGAAAGAAQGELLMARGRQVLGIKDDDPTP